jgi:predicted DNA-binding protein with PD1-like motif
MICKRLRRGDDLLRELKKLAAEENLELAVILSAVGCVTRARVRDAGGVTVRDIDQPCEIVSATGTVSHKRCHVHVSFAKEDLSAVGGHLMEGCIINTTCELVLGVVDGWRCGVEQDEETGYDEIVFEREKA